MVKLAETKNKLVTNVMRSNYKGLYNKLSTILSREQLTFFAKPEIYSDVTFWYSDSTGNNATSAIKDYTQLTNEQKDNVADQVETLKQDLIVKLASESEFKQSYADFFIIPFESDIKVIIDGNRLTPVLVQWGCKSNETTITIDPLNMVIERPRSTTAEVVMDVKYTDGAKAIDKQINVSYLEKVWTEKTNNEGLFNMGRCRIGATVTAFELIRGQRAYIQNFTVEQGKKYSVVFPYVTSASISVVDQYGTPLSDVPVKITYDGIEEIHPANAGLITIEELEAGKEIGISEQNRLENSQTHILEKDTNTFTLEVYVPRFAPGTIKVLDAEGNPEANYPVWVEHQDTKIEYNSGLRGIIELKKLEVGKEIRIIDKNNPLTFETFTVLEEGNEFVIKVTKIPVKIVKIRLVDHKNKPLAGVPVEFKLGGVVYKETTDGEGICRIAHEKFTDKQKVYAQF